MRGGDVVVWWDRVLRGFWSEGLDLRTSLYVEMAWGITLIVESESEGWM